MRLEGMGTAQRWEFCKGREHLLDKPQIHPLTYISPDVVIGKNVYIGPFTSIGYWGFSLGFDEEGRATHMAHTGRVIIEDDVEVGALCIVARGTVGDTILHRGVKLDDQIHIAHNCEIGEDAIITGCANLGGSVKIGKKVWLGQGCIIKNRVNIADYCYIGSGAIVLKDTEPYGVYVGNPARYLRQRKVGEE